MIFNNSFYIAPHGAAINFLIWTSSLSFLFRHFYLSTRFLFVLILGSSAIHWLTWFLSFWLFLVLPWMLWMLVMLHKPCHVPHASRVTTWGTFFTERPFSLSKEWIKSWSHAFLILILKRFLKSLRQWVQNPVEKETKKKKGNCKALKRKSKRPG